MHKVLKLIFILVVIGLSVAWLNVPVIDEFEVFNCITTPCDMPQITITQYIEREYFPEPYQIPDCSIEAC